MSEDSKSQQPESVFDLLDREALQFVPKKIDREQLDVELYNLEEQILAEYRPIFDRLRLEWQFYANLATVIGGGSVGVLIDAIFTKLTQSHVELSGLVDGMTVGIFVSLLFKHTDGIQYKQAVLQALIRRDRKIELRRWQLKVWNKLPNKVRDFFLGEFESRR